MKHIAPFILILLTLSSTTSIINDCAIGDNGGSKFASTIIVDQSGAGNFKTVQSAIDSIPLNNRRWIKVQINPGVYKEKVSIPRGKPCVVLEGQDSSVTTITFDAHDRTDTSATFTSIADNFAAKGITFKNSYDHPLLLERLNGNGPIPGVSQAVAARILGDKSAFFECSFLGLQDTLWDAQGRHYFFNCHIEGAVDFVFGNGQSFYEKCSISATAGKFASQLPEGYITAQGRQSSDDPSGFVFEDGEITGSMEVYLGRAYGPYSRVIFIGTAMNVNVAPPRWDAWRYHGQEQNFMYAEVGCKGPGSPDSSPSRRVPWEKKLNSSQLQQFSRSSFVDFDGWIGRLPLEN